MLWKIRHASFLLDSLVLTRRPAFSTQYHKHPVCLLPWLTTGRILANDGCSSSNFQEEQDMLVCCGESEQIRGHCFFSQRGDPDLGRVFFAGCEGRENAQIWA